MSSQHAGLLRRVTALMRPNPPATEPEPYADEAPADAGLEELRERILHLERVVEGLQDAVYRQSQYLDERVEELRARTEPAAIARELSADARRRGL